MTLATTLPKTGERECRSLVQPVETRTQGAGMTVRGYAAVFGEVAEVAGVFAETVAPGAFARSLGSDDIRAFYDHDTALVLGRNRAGTLRLAEDGKGLAVEIDLPDTSAGRDVRTLIERGDVSGMSFGFEVVSEEWDFSQPMPLRTIRDVNLFEVSIVSIPAYAGTTIALRSLESARKTDIRSFAPLARLRMKIGLDLTQRS
ncbi:HK97 family phage prohead protease [Allorhizobium sp. BGMRC 0089]|uniref:HK97 family phage prohead protease n=1 Tax=Allorhizobium sonneratiae TaxID=2934936 RepID=UPI0020344F26|nr:HK97 family phage prohead protease [Allorhizobium sonneratiae]MCM2292288.1 HK97 family phage prohead protease [Allorhizobium sonneratiae]